MPVKEYHIPNFPTRALIDEHAELLYLVPKRWQVNSAVLAVLSVACSMLSASRVQAANDALPSPKIAPVFQHGEGRSATGGAFIIRPVYLSESEAREIIVEEAKRHGIEFTAESKVYDSIPTPALYTPSEPEYAQMHSLTGDAKSEKLRFRRRPIVFDGVDKRKSIFYEFVSINDLNGWKIQQKSDLGIYETLDVARTLRDGLAQTKLEGTFAVFYDPLSFGDTYSHIVDRERAVSKEYDFNKERENLERETRDATYEQLREQVRDFIKWLKAEGVI